MQTYLKYHNKMHFLLLCIPQLKIGANKVQDKKKGAGTKRQKGFQPYSFDVTQLKEDESPYCRS